MSAKPAFQTWTVTEPYLNLHCELGEGPFHEKATNSLRFVDIIGKRLHAVDLERGPESVTTLQLDTPISVTADVAGLDPRQKIAFGAKYGLALLDRASGKYEYVARFGPDNERLRANDGAVDPHGRFWLGSMTDFTHLPFLPEGTLYVFDGAKSVRSKKHPMTIPNTVSWSPDGKTMYFTDSAEATIYACDYSSDDNAISNERVFYKHTGPGLPDGHRVDVDGNLWSTFYGGSNVLKISPSGEVIGEIKLPTKNITCTQFVGTELFITTAAMKEGEGTAEEVEKGGALFRVDVGVQGLDLYEFKLNK
ncbi:hypothetical protein DL769_010348 [Monosporascus sp. CRB-8-3]|nr:hypothetical protein DL769_010348 [Monosporascus sp. CRB-8-3]